MFCNWSLKLQTLPHFALFLLHFQLRITDNFGGHSSEQKEVSNQIRQTQAGKLNFVNKKSGGDRCVWRKARCRHFDTGGSRLIQTWIIQIPSESMVQWKLQISHESVYLI